MAKHKYIESPEMFWQLFVLYKESVINNPIKKHVFVGKDGVSDYELRDRPLTMVGFECFVMNNTEVSYPDLTEYFEGKNQSYKDYFPIASRIKKEIEANQVEGGMAMIFSQSITARLNGLKEQTENVNIEKQIFKDIDLNVNTDNGTIEDS